MDGRKFSEFAGTVYYKAGSVLLAIGAGVAIGFAVDRIFAKKDEACPEELEDGWWEDAFEEDPVLPIPEGVNVIDMVADTADDLVDKVVNDKMFMKPDISKVIDYTKYSDISRTYGNQKEINFDEIVMPSDDDAPDAFDDDRFEIIDEAEFVKEIGNGSGYVSATGTYFVQDRILAGWNDDLSEKDISNTIGWRAVSMFDSPDVRAVYVRNSQLKVLYEIVRSDDSMESAIHETLFEEVAEIQEE